MDTLPPELLFSICSHLPVNDLISLTSTCWNFHEIYNDLPLWSHRAWSDFKFPKEMFLLLSQLPYHRYCYIKQHFSHPSIDSYMYHASRRGLLPLITYLVKRNRFRNRSKQINDALCTASRYGHFECVRFLVESGADDIGHALGSASCGQSIEITCMKDFDPKIVSPEEKLKIVKFLLSYQGSSVTVKNLNFSLQRASRSGYLSIVKFLIAMWEEYQLNIFRLRLRGRNVLKDLKSSLSFKSDLTEWKI